MSIALYCIALVAAIVALCGNYSCGTANNMTRSHLFDLLGGFAVGLAFVAGRLA